jgi:hypothetical protein
MDKIILDLCGGTGSWSKPYADAGYDVRVITLPDHDVRLFEAPRVVHGVLAAPPCTYFCRARMCQGKPTEEQFLSGLAIVDACMRIILLARPDWWALENPQGYLKRWLGEPQLKFDPWHYGDPWTKRTWIWGRFQPPLYHKVQPVGPWVNSRTGDPRGHNGIAKARDRAVTPPGFAQAFFKANP